MNNNLCENILLSENFKAKVSLLVNSMKKQLEVWVGSDRVAAGFTYFHKKERTYGILLQAIRTNHLFKREYNFILP